MIVHVSHVSRDIHLVLTYLMGTSRIQAGWEPLTMSHVCKAGHCQLDAVRWEYLTSFSNNVSIQQLPQGPQHKNKVQNFFEIFKITVIFITGEMIELHVHVQYPPVDES